MNVLLPRVGAACGAVFAIVLFVAAGNGGGTFSGLRAVAGLAAITLAVPFIVYVGELLRRAEGATWLSTTAVAAGVTGIGLKLVSTFPELAIHREHLTKGTPLHDALQQVADGATLICLYPLAVFCAATAIVALRRGVLPRWLGIGAAITAASLAVNGAFLEASFVPALVLFLVWTLATSIHLLRAEARASGAVVAKPRRLAG